MVVPAVATGILETIGNTPVVQLQHLAPEGRCRHLRQTRVLQSHRLVQRPDGARDDRRGRSARSPAARHARRRIHRRQHGVVAGDGLRRQRLCVRAALVGCVRTGEDPDDGSVRRGSRDGAERWRQGDAGFVRPVQAAYRVDEGRTRHVLDRPVPQCRCAERLSARSASSCWRRSGRSMCSAVLWVPPGCSSAFLVP